MIVGCSCKRRSNEDPKDSIEDVHEVHDEVDGHFYANGGMVRKERCECTK